MVDATEGCFRGGGGRPDGHRLIEEFNAEVQESGVDGFMCTAVTTGNVHEVNLRDKTILGLVLDQFDTGVLDLKGGAVGGKCTQLPFNVLGRW